MQNKTESALLFHIKLKKAKLLNNLPSEEAVPEMFVLSGQF